MLKIKGWVDGSLICLPLAVIRVKLRLPTSSMINRTIPDRRSDRTVGSVKFSQLLFVIIVGEELTVFGFVREECEKNVENHWYRYSKLTIW